LSYLSYSPGMRPTVGAAGVEGRAGDVQVRPGDPVRHELAQEVAGHEHAAATVPGHVRQVGDRGVQALAQVPGQRHRPRFLAGVAHH